MDFCQWCIVIPNVTYNFAPTTSCLLKNFKIKEKKNLKFLKKCHYSYLFNDINKLYICILYHNLLLSVVKQYILNDWPITKIKNIPDHIKPF